VGNKDDGEKMHVEDRFVAAALSFHPANAAGQGKLGVDMKLFHQFA